MLCPFWIYVIMALQYFLSLWPFAIFILLLRVSPPLPFFYTISLSNCFPICLLPWICSVRVKFSKPSLRFIKSKSECIKVYHTQSGSRDEIHQQNLPLLKNLIQWLTGSKEKQKWVVSHRFNFLFYYAGKELTDRFIQHKR